MQSKNSGKVAIITGGGHGIGKAYAKHLALEGASVVIAEIDGKAAQQVAEELNAADMKAMGIQTDVSSEESLQEMVKQVIATFGRIDILINNAAIFATIPISRASFDQISLDEWDKVMNVNLKGTWLASRAVVPEMKNVGKGKIITIASGTAFHGNGGRIHYVASKAATVGFTKTLARELGEFNINVNCVAPGSTLSEEDASDNIVKHRQAGTATRALKRVQTPNDLVGAVAFLCSGESDFITGQTLVVDGGNYMH
jgi:3-oxoacyl-[acyl-carrier protein] reductase